MGILMALLRRRLPARFVRALTCLLVLCAASAAAAQPGAGAFHTAQLLGGASGLVCLVDGEAPPPRSLALLEVARWIHVMAADGTGIALAPERLAAYAQALDDVAGELRHWPGGVSVDVTGRDGRERLKDLVAALGLRVQERNRRLTVDAPDRRAARERRALLACGGLNSVQLAERLNRGEAIRVAIPFDAVPLPILPEVWARAVFAGNRPAASVITGILADRRALLLYHGLCTVDEMTRAWLEENPTFLTRIYRDHAAEFAIFGRSIRVREGHVVVPAGRDLWEALLGRRAEDPERFLRSLLGRDSGRMAYFYDTLAQLDAPRRSFALGLHVRQGWRRVEAFQELAAIFVQVAPEWNVRDRPFFRPALDPGILLRELAIGQTGVPSTPLWKGLMRRAMDAGSLPNRPERALRSLDEAEELEAAWLLQQILSDSSLQRDRFEMVLFAQRVFGRSTPADAPDILVALRGFLMFRALMLTLERTGIDDPALYAAAARAADRIMTVTDRKRLERLLAQFQGGVALIERARFFGAISPEAATEAARRLVAIPISDAGEYRGRLAQWITATFPLEPSASHGESREARLLDEVLGTAVRPGGPTGGTRVVWEGLEYEFVPAGSARRRLAALRVRQGGVTLDDALTVSEAGLTLAAPGVTPEQVRRSATAIRNAAPRAPSSMAREIARIVRDLDRIRSKKDLRKAAKLGLSTSRIGDALLADALLMITYAHYLDGSGSDAVLRDGPRLHAFGLGEKEANARRRTPWQIAVEQVGTGVSWHLKGSLLGLDLPLADQRLQRISPDQPIPHTLGTLDRRAFIETIVLSSPALPPDADVLASAIDRGEERLVNGLTSAELLPVMEQAGVSPSRANLLPWIQTHEPDAIATVISLTELLWIGEPQISEEHLNRWGVSAYAATGCLCRRLPRREPWETLAYRLALPLLPTVMADVNLQLGKELADLGLPAGLLPHLLAAVLPDYLIEVRMTDPDDWLTLVRHARAISRARLEDYVSSVAAFSDGPLVPVSSAGHGPTEPRKR